MPNIQFLNGPTTENVLKKYSHMKSREILEDVMSFDGFRNRHLDNFFGGEFDRRVESIDVSVEDTDEIRESNEYITVSEALRKNGFKVKSFNLGIAVVYHKEFEESSCPCESCFSTFKSHNPNLDFREYKIGKVLTRFGETDANKVFMNSPLRNKKDRYIIVYSRNAYDYLSQSTNKGWTSCMGVSSGNYSYVQRGLLSGGFIAYVFNEDWNPETEIDSASGRILIKALYDTTNNKRAYATEASAYGRVQSGVLDKIRDTVSNLNKLDNGIAFCYLPHSVYRDGIINDIIVKSSNFTVHDFIESRKNIPIDNYPKIIEEFDDHNPLLMYDDLYSIVDEKKIDVDKFITSQENQDIDKTLRAIYPIISRYSEEQFRLFLSNEKYRNNLTMYIAHKFENSDIKNLFQKNELYRLLFDGHVTMKKNLISVEDLKVIFKKEELRGSSTSTRILRLYYASLTKKYIEVYHEFYHCVNIRDFFTNEIYDAIDDKFLIIPFLEYLSERLNSGLFGARCNELGIYGTDERSTFCSSINKLLSTKTLDLTSILSITGGYLPVLMGDKQYRY